MVDVGIIIGETIIVVAIGNIICYSKGVNSEGGSGTSSVPQIGGEICLNPGALGF